MSIINFNKAEKNLIIEKIQSYFNLEMDVEMGQFDADFLLDFFANEIGVYFYNQGLRDAQVVVKNRLENLTEAIEEIERITEFQK